MSDFPNVQILMATYNGEKFLAEQLDSILGQAYPNWELLIRDDGSKDTTPYILNAYQQNHPNRIKIVRDNDGNSGGYTQNFAKLMSLSTADIVAFSDQDDVWLPEKIARNVAAMEKIKAQHGAQKPALVHHDFRLVDADKNLIAESFDRVNGNRKASPTQPKMPYAAHVHGFSMIANRALVEQVLPFPKVALGHDSVMGSLAQDIGVIEFIPEQLALYRRHDNNSSQSMSLAKRALHKIFKESSMGTICGQLQSIFAEAHSNLANKSDATKEYLKSYGELLQPERKAELEKLAHIQDLGALERKMTIYKYSGTSQTSAIIASLIL